MITKQKHLTRLKELIKICPGVKYNFLPSSLHYKTISRIITFYLKFNSNSIFIVFSINPYAIRLLIQLEGKILF